MFEQLLALVARVVGPMIRVVAGPLSMGEITIDVTATTNYIVIPDWLKGCYVEVAAISTDIDVLLATSAAGAAVVHGQNSTIDGSRIVTVHASSGRRVIAGTVRTFLIPADATHFGWDAAGAGVLQISRTSGKIV